MKKEHTTHELNPIKDLSQPESNPMEIYLDLISTPKFDLN